MRNSNRRRHTATEAPGFRGGGVFGEKFEPRDEKSKNPKISKNEKTENPLAKMPALETRLLAGFGNLRML